MTTETLRKHIKVTDWKLTSEGLTISYERDDSPQKNLHLILTPEETLGHLNIVGSIEDVNNSNMAYMDGQWYHFVNLVKKYKMCQYEALQIVIRFEGGKELEKDKSLLEMDAAISAIKNI